MPVHIGEMSSEVTVLEGDLPLNEEQLNKLVQLVLKKLSEKEREQRYIREDTQLRHQAAPALRIAD
jgi:hypothetical protein